MTKNPKTKEYSDVETCYRLLDRYHPALVAEIKKIMQEPDKEKRQVAVSLIHGAARYLAKERQ